MKPMNINTKAQHVNYNYRRGASFYTRTQPFQSGLLYPPGYFPKCEKCGGEVYSSSYYNGCVYTCQVCEFRKAPSHVSFGLFVKIPNYHSITHTHAADKLFFEDGSSIYSRIIKHNNKFITSKEIANKKWEMWINQNTIEIVKLAALSEKYNLGCSEEIDDNYSPGIHLLPHVKKRKELYLTFLNIVEYKSNKRRVRIGSAIDYALKKSDSIIWLGKLTSAGETMLSASIRLNKYRYPFLEIENFSSYLPLLNKSQAVFGFPVYITGPSMYDVRGKYTQEELDLKVDKFLTDANNSLPAEHKIKIIVNTGNSGIETSAIRWAVKNNIYSVVVNLSSVVSVKEDGSNEISSVTYAIQRLLNIPELNSRNLGNLNE